LQLYYTYGSLNAISANGAIAVGVALSASINEFVALTNVYTGGLARAAG